MCDEVVLRFSVIIIKLVSVAASEVVVDPCSSAITTSLDVGGVLNFHVSLTSA